MYGYLAEVILLLHYHLIINDAWGTANLLPTKTTLISDMQGRAVLVRFRIELRL
jgi:hypothetical protein